VIVDDPTSHTELSGFEVCQFTDGAVNIDDGNRLIDDLFYYASYHDTWNAHVHEQGSASPGELGKRCCLDQRWTTQDTSRRMTHRLMR
jgi:hypothetical protein